MIQNLSARCLLKLYCHDVVFYYLLKALFVSLNGKCSRSRATGQLRSNEIMFIVLHKLHLTLNIN